MISRAQIIAEIRRTAIANGEKPLGKSRFFAETGIRESDWSGLYWARWSDALAEAGFSPNELNAALPEDELLGKLAAYVVEMGRFPVFSELRLKARSDPTFPSHNTFRRFGGKRELARKLSEYGRKVGLHQVVTLADALGTSDQGGEIEPESDGGVTEGFVYLFKSGRHFKIGRTNAMGRRERELAIQLPEPVELVHAIRTDDAVGIERYWHLRFASKRLNGEWFRLTAADVAAFKRRKFM